VIDVSLCPAPTTSVVAPLEPPPASVDPTEGDDVEAAAVVCSASTVGLASTTRSVDCVGRTATLSVPSPPKPLTSNSYLPPVDEGAAWTFVLQSNGGPPEAGSPFADVAGNASGHRASVVAGVDAEFGATVRASLWGTSPGASAKLIPA
jgi:hypothetical protein